MQKIQEIKTFNDTEALNVFWTEAEMKAEVIPGLKSGNGKNGYSISFMVWKTNVGVIAEADMITVSGNNIYEAMNKVISKIAQINNVELEAIIQ